MNSGQKAGKIAARLLVVTILAMSLVETSVRGQDRPAPGGDAGPILRKDRRRTGGQNAAQPGPPQIATGQGDIKEAPGGGYDVKVVPAQPTEPPPEAPGLMPGKDKPVIPSVNVFEEAARQRAQRSQNILLLAAVGAGVLLLGLVVLVVVRLCRGAPRPTRSRQESYPSWMNEGGEETAAK